MQAQELAPLGGAGNRVERGNAAVAESFERFSRDQLAAQGGEIFVAGDRQFVLGGKLGDGAIGVVRRATDRKTGKQYAVKFLAPEPKFFAKNALEDIYERFKKEGEKGATLSHDHLVKVVAYEENENSSSFENGVGPCNPFIVMEYVHGTTLEHYIMGRKSEGLGFNITPYTLRIAHSVTSALLYLHSNPRNLVHRDVKPGNIFLSKVHAVSSPQVVKLGDFGVVKWGDYKTSITSGTLTITYQSGLGTLKYMSFEQATNPKAVTVRSDMFSLGVTLFELFTNQIFGGPHAVFQLVQQRLQRNGTVMSKLYDLGLRNLDFELEGLFSDIYDMMLPAASGRPSSKQIESRLRYLLEREEYNNGHDTPTAR